MFYPLLLLFFFFDGLYFSDPDKDRTNGVHIADSFPLEALKTFLSFLYMMLGKFTLYWVFKNTRIKILDTDM